MLRQLRCNITSVPRLVWKHSFVTFRFSSMTPVPDHTYLLGLLAMIKCSICSYQCDNWYVSNWRLACHIYFSLGKCALELAQGPSRVALAWHIAGGSSPFGVTVSCGEYHLCLITVYISSHPQPALVPISWFIVWIIVHTNMKRC